MQMFLLKFYKTNMISIGVIIRILVIEYFEPIRPKGRFCRLDILFQVQDKAKDLNKKEIAKLSPKSTNAFFH